MYVFVCLIRFCFKQKSASELRISDWSSDVCSSDLDLLKALSHVSRLLILCILAEGEKSVSELEELLSMPQAAVSQQLARLRFDRLVQTRRDGRKNGRASGRERLVPDVFVWGVAGT